MEKQRPNIKEGHPNQDLYKNNTKKNVKFFKNIHKSKPMYFVWPCIKKQT